jgi:hypothetical protein
MQESSFDKEKMTGNSATEVTEDTEKKWMML